MSWSESRDGLVILCDNNIFERLDKYQSQLACVCLCSYITPQLFVSGVTGDAASVLNLTCILPHVDLIYYGTSYT